MTNTIYLKISKSICTSNKIVTLKDMATIYCNDENIKNEVEQLNIYTFKSDSDSKIIISSLKLIELIEKAILNSQIVALGEIDTVIYYKKAKKENKLLTYIKIVLACLIAFFGSAYAIMTYNVDVSASELFLLLNKLILGKYPNGPTILEFSYSIGLSIGIFVFFNHFFTKKISREPSPLEVQMRLYEQDVNTAEVISSDRNKESIDVN